MRCTRCRKRPPVSVQLGLCEVCVYEDAGGPAKAARQVELAERERVRIEAEKAKAKR